MTYTVTFTNGNVYTTLGPGVIDSKLGGSPGGISIFGPSTVGYGQYVANNFVRLLENSASSSPPTYPIAGQLWWDTATFVLSYFDGNKFKPCSSSELGPTPPTSPLDGDQWWNTTTNQLNVYNGASWMVVGPGYTKGQGISGVNNTYVTDVSSQQHLVSELTLNGNVVAIVSSDNAFSLATNISGITTVEPGINLISNALLNGVSFNSQRLLGSTWSSPLSIGNVTPNSGSFTTLSATAQTIGNVLISAGTISAPTTLTLGTGNATISTNSVNGTIVVSNDPTPAIPKSVVTVGYSSAQDAATLASAKTYTDANVSALLGSPYPSVSNISALSSAINNDPLFFNNVYVAIGFKANANNPQLTGNVSVAGSIIPTGNVTSDIGSTTNNFNNVYAAGFISSYADLAEKYEADNLYSAGTVVVFGGDKEITVSSTYCDSRVAGVVSTMPAYTMNEDSNGLAIALTGKVLCKVVGPVKKGDILVNSTIDGVATALTLPSQWIPGCVIGKSLENDSNINLREITIVVGRF